MFCDNNSAVRDFARGCSASAPICRIIGCTWQLWIEAQIVSWVEWVHTASNPADALTRPGCAAAAQRMGLQLGDINWHSKRMDVFQ